MSVCPPHPLSPFCLTRRVPRALHAPNAPYCNEQHAGARVIMTERLARVQAQSTVRRPVFFRDFVVCLSSGRVAV